MLEQRHPERCSIRTDGEMKIYTPRCSARNPEQTDWCRTEQAPVRIYNRAIKVSNAAEPEQAAETKGLFF